MNSDLADGVHALPLTFETGGREATITPTVVETDRGAILVDAGLPSTVDALETALSGVGLDLGDVSMVLVTHHDGDHAGGLRAVTDRTDALVLAHPEETPYVDGRQFPVKAEGDDRYPPVDVDVEVVGGVRFRTHAGPMVVVETPGHSPGHVSLHFPAAGLLVAGDALVSESGHLDGPKPEYTPGMDRAMASVATLADLDVSGTLCYHGGYVPEGTAEIAAVARGD